MISLALLLLVQAEAGSYAEARHGGVRAPLPRGRGPAAGGWGPGAAHEGVASVVAAIGFGLLGVAYAQDFDDLPLAVTATAVEGTGIAIYAAATMSMIRNRRGLAGHVPRTPPHSTDPNP